MITPKARNPYVMVLVDGDGACFQDNLLRDADAGGSKAASKLRKQVDEALRETPLEHGTEVFARVYANFRGLNRALRSSGVVRYTDDVEKFARAFTNARPGFDFVDVDYGKENADFKIRRELRMHFLFFFLFFFFCGEMRLTLANHADLLKWHYMDERCKKIFFVACHDAGYVHDLRPLADENSDRIILVETTPAQPAFRNLGLTITHFDDVFRDAPLEPRNPFNAPASPVQSTAKHIPAATPPQAPATVEPKLERRSSVEQRPGSYAAVCGDGKDVTIVLGKGKRRKPAAAIQLNEDGHRIDPPIPEVSIGKARASFDKKLAEAKANKGAFCNKHYLEGGCDWGSSCKMEHDVVLTAEEVRVLRYKARTGPCANGPTCDDASCSRGHHCPLDPDCPRPDCQFNRSRFGDMHLTKKKMKAM